MPEEGEQRQRHRSMKGDDGKRREQNQGEVLSQAELARRRWLWVGRRRQKRSEEEQQALEAHLWKSAPPERLRS